MVAEGWSWFAFNTIVKKANYPMRVCVCMNMWPHMYVLCRHKERDGMRVVLAVEGC